MKINGKLKSNEQFIKECTEVHGNKYDYSETFIQELIMS